MGPRIALLLSGEPADLPASICAVQLAARSDSELYALQVCLIAGQNEPTEKSNTDKSSPEGRFLNSFSFVTEFAEKEGVQVSCHILDSQEIEQMVEFLTAHAITCLVVNKSDGEQEKRSAWLKELQKQLTIAPRQFHSPLQVITATLWEDMDIKEVLRQFRCLDRLMPRKIKRRRR